MNDDLVTRLQVMHDDLRQGAYYTPKEDPDWDATLDAAAEIKLTRILLAQKSEEIERLHAIIRAFGGTPCI